ncbi:MAG TPA: response regulator [Blastocatellia bacterium]|jgi:two-component system response regulator GlrR|nr:response regulator [Blastocatellia bacterium]
MPKGTVLIIEDNRDILEAIRLLLENDGFKIITAEDCSTAFDHLTMNRPDLILTDLMLPEMTGLEFIHQIRRMADYDRVPIIAISAYDRTYLAAAVGAGAITALHKPDDLDILVQTVREVINNNNLRDTARQGH